MAEDFSAFWDAEVLREICEVFVAGGHELAEVDPRASLFGVGYEVRARDDCFEVPSAPLFQASTSLPTASVAIVGQSSSRCRKGGS